MESRHRLSLEIDEALAVQSDRRRLQALQRLVEVRLAPAAIAAAPNRVSRGQENAGTGAPPGVCELQLADLAQQKNFAASAAMLARLSGLPAPACETALRQDNPDLVIIICRALNLAWSTVQALLDLRPGGPPAADIRDDICDDYHRIAIADAQRVQRFLKIYFRLGSPPRLTSEDDRQSGT